MQPIIKRLTMLCTGALLLACAGPGTHAPSGARMAADAEQAYLIGRNYHMALRPQQALAYYRSALRDDPNHLNARNGLAVLYAEQGQLELAIALWQELTASAAGRSQAFLFSNLGYAHLIHGEPARALAVLEQACLLDPLNERAWQHLGDALQRTGQSERARAMHRQAEALRGHDIRTDYALAPGAGGPALDSALRSAPPASPWAQTEVTLEPSGMFVMRRVEPAPKPAAATTAAPPVPAARAASARPLLEISNGNGVNGMARSLARSLGEDGPRVVRLSNQKGFGVKRTRVEYRPDFRAAAELLAGQVGAARVVKAGKQGRADLRLVLGRDLAKPARPALAALPKTAPKPG